MITQLDSVIAGGSIDCPAAGEREEKNLRSTFFCMNTYAMCCRRVPAMYKRSLFGASRKPADQAKSRWHLVCEQQNAKAECALGAMALWVKLESPILLIHRIFGALRDDSKVDTRATLLRANARKGAKR